MFLSRLVLEWSLIVADLYSFLLVKRRIDFTGFVHSIFVDLCRDNDQPLLYLWFFLLLWKSVLGYW